MNSLRSRLILGSALIAVIPLALAMFLMARQIESTVRTQAAARLNAALGGLQDQLDAEGERIAERLRILANDSQLKRLYLLKPEGSRELSEYIAERRFLLGLDFLRVADTSGAEIANDAAPSTSPSADRESWRVEAEGTAASGPQLVERTDGTPGMAMAASAPIRYDRQIAGVLQGGLVFDRDFLEQLGHGSGVDLILRDSAGRTVAATLETPETTLAVPSDVARIERAEAAYLGRSFSLEIGSSSGASIAGLIPTTSSDRTIQALRTNSVVLGLMGLGVAVLLGVLWSSQISRPVERLAAFSHRLAQGKWDEPLSLHSVRELETLVAALERMRIDLGSYRDRLVVSERHAAWSQMARTVAHEVKNPLTPIAVSVADLKRSFEQQRPDFPAILDQAVRTISEEVETLKHLLQEFSDFGRIPVLEFTRCRVDAMFADLEVLYGRDVAEGRLVFQKPDGDVTLTADAGQLRQALINLIKNGLEALDGSGRVTVSAASAGDAVELAVADTGPGLALEQQSRPFAPGFTTKRHGSGLGLTIVERIVNDHRGTIAVDTGPQGTTFRIRLPRDLKTLES